MSENLKPLSRHIKTSGEKASTLMSNRGRSSPRVSVEERRMLDKTTQLQALVHGRKPGHSLDAPFYTSPEIFEADMEAIFGRHWIYVGVEPDVPEPGDVMTIDIGHNSI